MRAIRSLRLLSSSESISRQKYSSGEIFYDQNNKTLRIMDGVRPGGYKLLRADLSNLETEIGATSTSTAPTTSVIGTLWFDPNTETLNVYNGTEWINITGAGGGLSTEQVRDLAAGLLTDGTHVGISFVHDDANNKLNATVSLNLNALTDVDTLSTPPTAGQVLKWNGTTWVPADDVTAGGAGLDASTLNGFAGTYYLDYNNFTNTPTIPAAQVQVDWDATSGITSILNKPALFSGSYNDLTNIPTAFANLDSISFKRGVAVAEFSTDDTLGGTLVSTDIVPVQSAVKNYVDNAIANSPGGSSFDQSLNTTDDVTFNTVTASQLLSTGIGVPTYTSASDFIFNAGSANSGQITVNGAVSIATVLRLTPLSSAPATVAGSFAVANGVQWDPAGKGGAVPYPVFFNGVTWLALY